MPRLFVATLALLLTGQPDRRHSHPAMSGLFVVLLLRCRLTA